MDMNTKTLLPATHIKEIPAKLIREFCKHYSVEVHTTFNEIFKKFRAKYLFDKEEVLASFGLIESEKCKCSERAFCALNKYKASQVESVKEGIWYVNYVTFPYGGRYRKYPKKERGIATKLYRKGDYITFTFKNGETVRKYYNNFNYEQVESVVVQAIQQEFANNAKKKDLELKYDLFKSTITLICDEIE